MATFIDTTAPQDRDAIMSAVMPLTFAVLWSTGFIGARYGLPFAEPLTLLSMRFAVTEILLIIIVLASGAVFPTLSQSKHLAVTGILAHAGYLGGNFYSMSLGMPLALVALIGGLQPLLTAAIAGRVLGETVDRRVWVGLALGLAGAFLVLWPKLGTGAATLPGIAGVVFGLFCMTAATVYQKKYVTAAPLLSGAAVQFLAAVAVLVPVALVLESNQVHVTPQLVFAVGWLAVVLSIGASTLLWYLIRRGAASKVTSVFYLVPPITALLAFILFGEALAPVAIAGMALAAAGVALVTTGKKVDAAPVKPAAIE
jgi:drug/metabolite transporter (DMT)-like permease